MFIFNPFGWHLCITYAMVFQTQLLVGIKHNTVPRYISYQHVVLPRITCLLLLSSLFYFDLVLQLQKLKDEFYSFGLHLGLINLHDEQGKLSIVYPSLILSWSCIFLARFCKATNATCTFACFLIISPILCCVCVRSVQFVTLRL